MAREAHPDRAKALIAIGEHVERLGKIDGQRAARRLFPNVGKPTWESWCRLVHLGERAGVEHRTELVGGATHPVTPITLMIDGVEPYGAGFDQRIAEIDAINRALKDVAWPIDPETGRRGRVKNPMLLKVARDGFAQSAALAAKHQSDAWSAEMHRAQMEEVMAVILDGLENSRDRELAGQLLASLRKVSKKWENVRDGQWQGGSLAKMPA
ncbi:hypothetical protein B0G80_4396 [Paraburkholderia sp. BL6669N2]|uniref:hypothetical protein n=1 Tax=Paraburkholderia sp. BL6669N2 TaxID=1938807 RepID=UPI000E2888B2|nr:hypothetical protein [Paraburkholderia sp. BL6669N2]REG61543.1 hypothetical protein B0G80_4396 [Paraburkholderia sp. BL6669N2]